MAIRFRVQLNGSPNEGENCGPNGVAHALDHMTKNAIRETAEEVRARCEPPAVPNEGTTSAQLLAATLSYGPVFKRHNLTPPSATRHLGAADDWVATALAAGHVVVLSLDHGYLNAHWPRYSGDKAFNGGHTVLLTGWRLNATGKRVVTVYDGLHDARRADIPQGPLVVRYDAYREAANSYAHRSGVNRATGLVCRRSKALVATPPPAPEPTETPAETIARLREVLATTKTQLAAATDAHAEATAKNSRLASLLAEREDAIVRHREALALARNALLEVGNDTEAALDAIAEAMPAAAARPDARARHGTTD